MKKEKEKIRIRLESSDPSILDQGTVSLYRSLKGLCTMHGPNLIPTLVDKYTVMRGTSKEVHEVKTHRRTIIVSDPVMRRDKNFFKEIGNVTVPNGIEVILSIG